VDAVTAARPAGVHRPLGPVERWFWIADQVSPLNVIARVRLTGRLEPDALERAVAALATDHPVLRMAIRTDPGGAEPVLVPSTRGIEVRRVPGGEREWEGHVDEYELATSLDWRTGPLARLTDISSRTSPEVHDLVLTVSHVIADATTALTLLRRLVEYAHRPCLGPGADGRGSPPVVPDAPERFLPARYRGMRGTARLAAIGMADGVLATLTRPSRLTSKDGPGGVQRHTRLVRRTLTSAQTDALVRRCREQGVSVHGALAAAMVMSVGPVAAAHDSGRICLGSPMDFRADLRPAVSGDQTGSYVSSVPSIARFGGGRDLWFIARRIDRSLALRRRFGQHLAMLWGLRFICPPSVGKSVRTFGFLARNGPLNVGIWNIGRFEFPERIGDWELSGAQFISGVMPFGVLAGTVNTSHGELCWNFTHREGAVSARSARRLADGCMDTLLTAVDGGRG